MSPGDGAVLVTGAGGAIGAAVCRALAAEGRPLVLVGRDLVKLTALSRGLPGGPHVPLALDVSDEAAWERAREGLACYDELRGVVAAAAVLSPIGLVGTFPIAEFRRCLDVNLTGTYLSVAFALEPLRALGGSVVAFSGGGATGPLPRFDAYAASKAAVVRLCENLAIALAPDGVRVNAVAPGFVQSALHEETIAAGPAAVGEAYHARTAEALASGGFDPPEAAAALTAYLLSGGSHGITGKLVSARWDPWEDEVFRRRLRDEPDLATLRRIDDQFFTAAGGR